MDVLRGNVSGARLAVVGAFVIAFTGYAALLLYGRASATTIVAIRSDTEIVIAADSLRIGQKEIGDKEDPRPQNVCKVFASRGAIFAITGWIGKIGATRAPADVVGEVLAKRATIEGAALEIVDPL